MVDSQKTSSSPRLAMTHFGAAGWRITDGHTTVLIDPYFSRIRTVKVWGTRFPPPNDDPRPIHDLEDVLETDTEAVDRHIDAADFICISHSHFNHCMDMPYIARKTGAMVIGTESTMNIARAGKVPRHQLRGVHGGEDYQFGNVSIKAIPSLHSALVIPSPYAIWDNCHYFDADVIPRDVEAPLRLKDYAEGGTLGYLIRFGERKVLILCSMNYIENEMRGLAPDIALIPSSPWRNQVYQYSGRLMALLDYPKTVIATHWDNQAAPFGADQGPQLQQAAEFISEIRAVSPQSDVRVPKHFETLEL